MLLDTKFVLPILKVIIYIILVGFFWHLYFYDQVNAYLKKSTAFRSSIENANKIESPNFILCFNPYFKPSIAKKYKLTNVYNLIEDQTEPYKKLNLTLKQYYDQFDYKLGRDFDLHFKLDSHGSNTFKFKAGLNVIDSNSTIDINHIVTIGSGTCTMLEVKNDFEMPSTKEFTVQIEFNSSLPLEDLPTG